MSRIEGFDSSLNLMEVLLWPFNDALRLQKILELKQAWYDANQTNFWLDWQRDVFDLRTANDFGLSVWAIILDLPLSFEAPPSDVDKVAFGFGTQRKNFNNGNFKRRTGGSVNLTTEQKRIALRLRYFQLITSGNAVDVNAFLLSIFGPEFGLVYVRDNLDMTITYVFTFVIPSQLRLVIDEFDLLPRPDGVGFDYTVDLRLPFGFEERGNFDTSNFEVEPSLSDIVLTDGSESILTGTGGAALTWG